MITAGDARPRLARGPAIALGVTFAGLAAFWAYHEFSRSVSATGCKTFMEYTTVMLDTTIVNGTDKSLARVDLEVKTAGLHSSGGSEVEYAFWSNIGPHQSSHESNVMFDDADGTSTPASRQGTVTSCSVRYVEFADGSRWGSHGRETAGQR